MTKFWLGFLIWMAFWFVVFAALFGAPSAWAGEHDSVYVPMCVSVTCHKTRNTVFLMTGPAANTPQGVMNFAGYLRNVKDELSFGMLMYSPGIVPAGVGLGFGYHF